MDRTKDSSVMVTLKLLIPVQYFKDLEADRAMSVVGLGSNNPGFGRYFLFISNICGTKSHKKATKKEGCAKITNMIIRLVFMNSISADSAINQKTLQ